MLAFTTRRRWQLSFARPLRHTHSSPTASASPPNRDAPSRVIRVFNLPLNYDVSTVVRAIVGTRFVERVCPHPDHISIMFYHWPQAYAVSKKRLHLYDKEHFVAWMDSRHSDADDSEWISAGVVRCSLGIPTCKPLFEFLFQGRVRYR